MELILASQSPRRRDLLERMGIRRFQVLSPGVDEHVDESMAPEALVQALSARKAAAVEAQVGQAPIILAADTVVALDGAILGKPKDAQDAAGMLRALSGREHQVFTGLTVLQGGRAVTEYEATQVSFRPLAEREIAAYVATGEPMDKAGAYGIQGYGALLVEGVCGDYYNVMGLPVCRLGRILARLGVDCLALAAGGLGRN